jgi:lysophospholipase L1-like esterase
MIIKNIISRSDADIVLVTSVCLDDNQQDELMRIYYDELDALAGKCRLPIVKVHEYWKSKISEGIDFVDLTLYDRAHPNEKGYQLMAEAIMQLFI